jgi:transposase-like protein
MCTPEEARAFLGLPDGKPMQEQLMREVQDRMTTNIRAMEPEAMLRTWLPATLKGFEQMQEIFMSLPWFKSMASARTILGGIEMVHMMRKGQAKYARNPQPSLAGQFDLLAA